MSTITSVSNKLTDCWVAPNPHFCFVENQCICVVFATGLFVNLRFGRPYGAEERCDRSRPGSSSTNAKDCGSM